MHCRCGAAHYDNVLRKWLIREGNVDRAVSKCPKCEQILPRNIVTDPFDSTRELLED